jgi:integrase
VMLSINHESTPARTCCTTSGPPVRARQYLTHVTQHESSQYPALFAPALDGGLRIGELLALRWKDLDASVVRVERQLVVFRRRGFSHTESGSRLASIRHSPTER